MMEEYLIECCSPTLASLKMGNIFNYPFPNVDDTDDQLAQWNQTLSEKGVRLTVLRRSKSSALVYVYRPAVLQKRLKERDVRRFLKRYGYAKMGEREALTLLSQRLAGSEGFPHEIGVFLGYPLCDVKAFIRNGGKNSLYTGCWKVYSHKGEAMRTFERFKKCSRIYSELWAGGRSVQKLTVAV